MIISYKKTKSGHIANVFYEVFSVETAFVLDAPVKQKLW